MYLNLSDTSGLATLIKTASSLSVLMAALIFSLSLARVAAAQSNTRLGTGTVIQHDSFPKGPTFGFDRWRSQFNLQG
jgi:hypothetical protein